MYAKKVVSEELTKECGELKFNIYMNMCLIYIKQEKYDRGLEVYLSIDLGWQKLRGSKLTLNFISDGLVA